MRVSTLRRAMVSDIETVSVDAAAEALNRLLGAKASIPGATGGPR